MMEFFKSIGLTPIHFILAYTGMVLHLLMKFAELSKDDKFEIKSYVKKNIYIMIASFIMIPLLLVLAADTSLKDILPINNVTAVLAGWQTQSTFKTLMGFYKGKKLGSSTDEARPADDKEEAAI